MSSQTEVIKLAGSCAVSSSREQHFSAGIADEEEEALALQDEPQPMTPQEKDEKRGIMRRISKYKALFGTECADLDLDPRSLDALVLEDLRDRARDTNT